MNILEWSGALSDCTTAEAVGRVALAMVLEAVCGGKVGLLFEHRASGEPIHSAISACHKDDIEMNTIAHELSGIKKRKTISSGRPAAGYWVYARSGSLAIPFGTGRLVSGVIVIQKGEQNREPDRGLLETLGALMNHAAFVLENILLRGRRRKGEGPAGKHDIGAHVEKVIRFFNEQYGRHIGRTETAALTGLSPDYLGKLFREQTGVTMGEYLNRVRVERSAAMLTATVMPIPDIARASGFTSGRTFFRVFHRVMGVSPGRYREGEGGKIHKRKDAL